MVEANRQRFLMGVWDSILEKNKFVVSMHPSLNSFPSHMYDSI